MNTVVSREYLSEIFDHVIREITQRETGIVLQSGNAELVGDLYTVYVAFNKGYYTCLSLCADISMFIRLTKRMLNKEDVTLQEVEIFTKEYFNVLCGHIASRLFRKTNVPARFCIPVFYKGRYAPENQLEHIVLTYLSDEGECVQLVHHAALSAE